MTNIQAINLLKGLEQSLDDYCELNDEGKTAFRMAITALEVFGNSEQLPSAQTEMDCMLKEYGDCTYSETGCSDCAIKANIKKALKAVQLEPYWEEGERK